MKKYKFCLLELIVVFLFVRSFAQWTVGVDSVQMYPPQPTSFDSVYFRFFNSFGSGGCYDHQNFLTINNKMIKSISEYCLGNYFYVCHDVDSFWLNPLEPGFYTLNYVLKIDSWPGCENFITLDSVFVPFYVQSQGYVGEYILREDCIDCKDLSNGGFILVNRDCISKNSHLIISDVLGKVLYSQKINQKTNQVKLVLDRGIYFITLFTDNKKVSKKIMISK